MLGWTRWRKWADGTKQVQECIAGRFRRPEARRRALACLRGLLSPVERKNGWQLAEGAVDATADWVQRLFYNYRWDADQVRDDLRAYVVDHLGDADGVLEVDETGLLEGRQGTAQLGHQLLPMPSPSPSAVAYLSEVAPE